ncbi:MAG TPA: Lrp/AsnC ligand binding domain-containing protein [Gemmatimonadales bacterium]|jgi:DNA-binding Lrp family transcriptional regulator
MVSAVVLLNVERHQINEIAQKLADLPGISEVYSVSGGYDLVAIVRVKTNEELADLVTAKLLKVSGIRDTETLISFRAYSRFDLESAFSLGPKKR